YLEMKAGDGQVDDLAAQVVKQVNESPRPNRVIVASFNLRALEEVKRLDAGVRTAAIFEPQLNSAVLRKKKMVDLAIRSEANEISLHHALAGAGVINKAKQSGLKVVVWAVDNPIWIKRALSLGIHALITNDPAAMLGRRSRLSAV